MRAFASVLLLVFLAPQAASQHCPSPLAERDWSVVDARALAASPRDERDLATLARFLSLAGEAESAKARAVYRWVTDNVAYDAPVLSGARRPSQSADSVFATRLGVCEGYARLAVDLLGRMGVEARYTTGTVHVDSSYAYDGMGHAWVAARTERGWILMDPTWGAGRVSDGAYSPLFRSAWFATPPDLMARTHFPDDPAFQLLDTPLTREQALADATPTAWCLRAPRRAPEATPASAPSSRPDAPERAWVTHLDVRFRFPEGRPARYARGSTQRLAIEVEDAEAVAVFAGGILLEPLDTRGGLWRGTFDVEDAPITVGVRLAWGAPWRMIAQIPVE